MANFNVFTPVKATVKIAASSSANGSNLNWSGEDRELRIVNTLNEVVFLKLSSQDDSTDATTSDFPIGPLATEVIGCGPTQDYASVITASGSGDVYLTEGKGA